MKSTTEKEPAAASKQARSQVMNVPNIATFLRLILAIVVFVLVAFELYVAGLVIFCIAAGTDWFDGWWARKFNAITKLGRILDPFCDKVIICGAFIVLAAKANSGIQPWVALVVVIRELLVTALRSFIEQQGGDFSANMAGKVKMVFQCAAVIASFVALILFTPDSPQPAWLWWTLQATIWLTVVSTVYSGAIYLKAAWPKIVGD